MSETNNGGIIEPAARILFLAPTIRVGSGGVADYSRRLAEELSHQGLECHLASWNEEGENRDGELFLGLPGVPPREKFRKLADYLRLQRIDRASLQFVNYGFGERGLIGDFVQASEAVANSCAWHVFFHELWQGHQRGAGFLERGLGWMQRRQILRLLRVLKPDEIWTNIAYYRRRLEEQDLQVDTVPNFGNIPIGSGNDDDRLVNLAGTKSGTVLPRNRYCFAGIFGTVYPGWPFDQVIPPLLDWAKKQDRTLVFVHFGKNRGGDEFIAQIESLSQSAVLQLGELDPERVDRVMQSMDIALATTPAEGIFKSGSVGFLERCVPLIAVPGRLERKGPPEIESHPFLVLADASLATRLDRIQKQGIPQPLLPPVVERYRKLFLKPVTGGNRAAGLSNATNP